MENDVYLYAMAMSDGRIQGITTGPYLYVECDESVNDLTHHIDVETREIKLKQALAYDLSVSDLTVTVTGLPSGLTAESNNMQIDTDDKPLVITYDLPGVYAIWLRGLAEYLDAELEVTVGDA